MEDLEKDKKKIGNLEWILYLCRKLLTYAEFLPSRNQWPIRYFPNSAYPCVCSEGNEEQKQ